MTREQDIKENAKQMNEVARQSLLPVEVGAAFQNRDLLEALSAEGPRREEVRERLRLILKLTEKGKAQDLFLAPKAFHTPVMLVGSGPSLDEAGPHLKNWKGHVMCSTSQARALVYYDHPPEYIVAYDVRTKWDELEGVDWSKYPQVGLCVHPGMSMELMEKWAATGNPIYTYRQALQGDQFRQEILPLAYPFIRSTISMGGCTLTTQLSMMHQMDYSVGFLVGVDFGNSRFAEWKLKGTPEGEKWVVDLPPVPDPTRAVESVTGAQTDSMQCFYKRQMFVINRMDRSVLISCSTPGKSAINELPWAPIAKVVERQGMGLEALQPSAAVVERICDVYLAQAGKYCIEVQGQPIWMEQVDPMDAIPKLLANVASQGARIPNVEAVMAYWKGVIHEAETGEGPLKAIREQWAEAAKAL
jgi:hypothetical protein